MERWPLTIRNAIEEGYCFDSVSRLVARGTVSFLKKLWMRQVLNRHTVPYFFNQFYSVCPVSLSGDDVIADCG